MSIYISEGFFKNRKKRKEEKEKQKKEKQFRYDVEEAKKRINKMIEWWQEPKQLEDYNCDIISLLIFYGISNSRIVQKANKSKNIEKMTFLKFIDWVSVDDNKDQIERFKKSSSKVVDLNDTICVIMVGDDSCIIGNSKNKELYEVIFDSNIEDTLIQKFKYDPKDLYPSKEAIIQADKELGYYKLSSPEDSSIKKVPFPIK